MQKLFLYSLCLFLLYSCSCSKEEVTLSPSNLVNLYVDWLKAEAIRKEWPEEEIKAISAFNMVKDKEVRETDCTPYNKPKGINNCYKINARRIDFIAIEFDTEIEALNFANQIKGFYLNNWVFDDVAGEPVLEYLAKEVFKAKRALGDESGKENL